MRGWCWLGIQEHCTPWWGALVSAWSASLRSFEAVHQGLGEPGIGLGVKGVRPLAYRYAERARVLQQAKDFALEAGGTLAGVSWSAWMGVERACGRTSGDEKPPRAVGALRVPGVNRGCSLGME
jgi:hypothetical protein